MNDLMVKEERPYLTITETAKILNVHRQTVWRYVKDDVFDNVVRGPIAGSKIRIPAESVRVVAEKMGIEWSN